MTTNKQLLGQFYTTTDPFNGRKSFTDWFDLVPKDTKFLEPFVGGGHILSYIDADWDGYDIEPKMPGAIQRDTLKDFPTGYRVCITNPPYLAKTVVSRKKLDVVLNYEDMYLDSLSLMLEHCEYVAAIIPSTFWNTNLFRDRLYAWDKFDMKLFSDTDAPAGVAYFVPKKVNKTRTFINGDEVFIGDWNIPKAVKFPIVFNPKEFSEFLVVGIDSTTQDNIHIRKTEGFDISTLADSEGQCKSTNRNIFPIKCSYLKEEDLPHINDIITEWRNETKDFTMTNFKSCQKSGKYRKRISFTEVRWILHRYYDRGGGLEAFF